MCFLAYEVWIRPVTVALPCHRFPHAKRGAKLNLNATPWTLHDDVVPAIRGTRPHAHTRQRRYLFRAVVARRVFGPGGVCDDAAFFVDSHAGDARVCVP